MQFPTSNRLLPLIGVSVLTLFMLIAGRSCNTDNSEQQGLKEVPRAAAADADTATDTLTTLTATVAAMTRELKTLRTDNQRLLDDNRSLSKEQTTQQTDFDQRIDRLSAELEKRPARDPAVASLEQRLDELKTELRGRHQEYDDGELPIGFGFDVAVDDSLVWIDPLDQQKSSLLPSSTRAQDPENLPKPEMTVPRNATLLGATAMTALLGRVPVRGEVLDPMPFKVLTGRQNLAANGYQIPGVAGMVWSGRAIGDWTLSCVTGELHSVTFVFEDGSIKTLSSDEQGGSTGSGRRPLAWISDRQGIPCVTGARKSNAATDLGQRFGVATLEAAADAAAAAQTQTVSNAAGGLSSAVDGDLASFILGRSAADGAAEVTAWLDERQAQSFDAVYVAAGANLVIHVDQELAIDRDPNARRLHYAP